MLNLDANELNSIILENIDSGIRVMDSNKTIKYWNANASKTLGVDGNQYLNRSMENDKKETSLFSDLIMCIDTERKISNKSKVRRQPSGDLIYYLVTVLPIYKEGVFFGAVEIIKDRESLGQIHKYISRPMDDVKISTAEMDVLSSNSEDEFFTLEEKLTDLLQKVKRVATMNYNVLIFGETGTGKEIITRIIHNNSHRKNKPLISQNCAAIPETLLESTFFGTEVGGFTGATDKKGLFELANGGTLLLDELNSLPVYLQAKLLRVLEDQRFRRVGGKSEIEVNTRVICTTNVKPEVLLRENKLREDLFYRLGPMYITIPPLRERKSDIDYLTRIFLKKECKLLNLSEPTINIDAKRAMRDYHWPGNVRELKNTINGILMNSPDLTKIEFKDLPETIRSNSIFVEEDVFDSDIQYQDRIEQFEKKLISRALAITGGNITEASKILGLKRQTLQYKVKKVLKQ